MLRRTYYILPSILLLSLLVNQSSSYAQSQLVKTIIENNFINKKQAKKKANVSGKKLDKKTNKKQSRQSSSKVKSNTINSAARDNKSKKSNNDRSEEITELIDFQGQIKVFLGDGRDVTGSVSLQVPKNIHFKHSKQGISYYKTIQLQDIKNIEFKAWKGHFIKHKARGSIYHFAVSRYTVQLKNGQVLSHKGDVLPFLQEFTLSNTNGSGSVVFLLD